MSSSTPNMGLKTTNVGEPGPKWAESINESFEKVDTHDHTPGRGTPVPSSGIDVNSDFQINGHNLDAVRMLRFGDQPASPNEPKDKRGLSVVGGDLYYNNGSGVPVKITDGAALAASSLGGISGLPSIAYPNAGANFDSSFPGFELSQASKTYARLKVGEVRIHEAGAFDPHPAIIKSAPGMNAPLNLTLPPAAPAANAFLNMAPSGAITAQQRLGAIVTSDIANGAVTREKTNRKYAKSGSCGAYSLGPNKGPSTFLTFPLTTAGGPVFVGMIPDTATPPYESVVSIEGGVAAILTFAVNGDAVAGFSIVPGNVLPVSAYSAIVELPAGTHSFTVRAFTGSGTTFRVNHARLAIYDI